ncbi:MAG TPA: hypothetical protein VD969_23340 [Symbiobacteriaceae bacterium]|nr:hypothetical protein [Symbiobacteriaceae bacterium]
MKRGWMIAGVAAAVLVGTVAVAQARGPGMMGGGPGMMGGGGPGMMGGGPGLMGGGPGMMGGGRGMMGGGRGMMGGGALCLNGGATYDPAAAATHAEWMVTRHKAMLANYEAQLAAATDETTKAWLEQRIEQQKLVNGAQEVHVAVLQAQPETWNEAALLTAQAEVDYWSKATATNAANQAWIALRLEQAKAHLTYVESLQTETN